jgi:hypothetical protein
MMICLARRGIAADAELVCPGGRATALACTEGQECPQLCCACAASVCCAFELKRCHR